MTKAKFTADETERANLLNKAEVTLADDVFSIPVFSRPAYPAQLGQGQGRPEEPDAAGLDLELRDVECHLVANASSLDVQ